MIESPPSALSNALPHAQKNKIFARTAICGIAQTGAKPPRISVLPCPFTRSKRTHAAIKKNMLSDTRPSANNGNKTMTTTTKQTPHSRMTDRVRQRLPASTIVDSTRLARERLPIRLCTAADPATHDRLSEYTRWQSQASTVANLSTRHRFDRHSDKTRLARWRNNQTQQQNGKT